jgi:hypothetical protein
LGLLSCIFAFLLALLSYFLFGFQVFLGRLVTLLRRSGHLVKALLQLSIQNVLQLKLFIALRQRHGQLIDELLHLLCVG